MTNLGFFKVIFKDSPVRICWTLFLTIIGEALEGLGFLMFLPLIRIFTQNAQDRMLPLLLLAIVAVFAGKNIFLYFSRWFAERSAVDFEENLKKKVVTTQLQSRWSFYSDQKIGALLNATTTYSSQSLEAFRNSMELFSNGINVGVYCLLGLWISWKMFLFSAVGGVLAFFLLRNVIQLSRKSAKQVVSVRNDCQGEVLENFTAFKYIKGNHLENSRAKVLFEGFKRLKEVQFKTFCYFAIVRTAPDFIIALLMSIIFYVSFVIFQVPGESILVLSLALYQVNRKIMALQVTNQKLAALLPSFEFCRDLICAADGKKEITGDQRFTDLKEGIRLRGVFFEFGQQPVLDSVDIDIKKNQLTALVGRSGSGKTTILDLLLGLWDPRKGSVEIDGVPLTNYDIFSWRSKVSYVPQEPFLFNTSIEENVRVGCEAATFEDVRRACELADADEFIQKSPKKYGTIIGERGVKLSGGQRQRIALARALVRSPQLLILDEATSALDNESERTVQQAIQGLRGHLTILIVAHRLTTIESADQIYVLDNHRIVSSGTSEGLRSNSSLFNLLYFDAPSPARDV